MDSVPSSLLTRALRKEYPGTIALRDISVRFDGGTIHALLGKNGAGKTTLVKIFSGATCPDSGEIFLNGRRLILRSPQDALRNGIATVYQELSLVPGLTVAENIFLGRLPVRRLFRGAVIDWNETNRRARELLDAFGVSLDVRARAGTLGVAQQQMVEIVKAMSTRPSVLMLDEPTSALSRNETERLFTLLRSLAARGVILLYITHRLEEVHRIADSITVLRDGAAVGTVPITRATPAVIVQMMFGERIQETQPADLPPAGSPAMVVRGLSRRGAFHDISFTLHGGEVLGLAGLLGSGRTELLRALFGADIPDGGHVTIGHSTIRPHSPAQMKRLGVALAPENRKEEGLVQILSTQTNICLASLARVSRGGFTTGARERTVARSYIHALGIAVSNPAAPVASLSGGNQQKVVISKWLHTSPRVVLLDEPTRGIDLQAKQQVFQIIRDLSRKGIGTIVVSSELEELLSLCHRVLVMKGGAVKAELFPRDATLEQLVSLCMS
jgi:ribose transport system ATP-binding protein